MKNEYKIALTVFIANLIENLVLLFVFGANIVLSIRFFVELSILTVVLTFVLKHLQVIRGDK